MENRGLPLLSGPPPAHPQSSNADIACRKCNKEFNVIFSRPRKCNHCGYSYCQTCTDYQALMPRSGSESGYTVAPVCAFCIEFLSITARGRGQLKPLSMSKLRGYLDAYNIKTNLAVEKDDLIDAVMNARGQNGCLSHANEEYYRKYSVPNRITNQRPRGLFSSRPEPPPVPARPPPLQQNRPEFARPDLAPDQLYPQQSATSSSPRPQPPPPPPHTRPQPTARPPYHPPSPYQTASASRSSQNINQSLPSTPPRQRATSAAPRPGQPAAAPSPPPTLEMLLMMPKDDISKLSVSKLKEILFANHVNAGLVLEKAELVNKVCGLVDAERSERERHAVAEEAERLASEMVAETGLDEGEVPQDTSPEMDIETAGRTHEAVSGNDFTPPSQTQDDNPAEHTEYTDPKSQPAPKSMPAQPRTQQAMTAALERTGLCVVCQDEEANIAIVDCGHLAMCRGCSDLIMASTRECPLCRTRIVTEARLLRIFKT